MWSCLKKIRLDYLSYSVDQKESEKTSGLFFLSLWSVSYFSFSEIAKCSVSSTLAWKIPWTEKPGRLQSMGSLRVGHDWATSLSLFTFMHWRRKWQPTPMFLPRESQGRGSLVGCRLWGAQSRTRLKRLCSSSVWVEGRYEEGMGDWGVGREVWKRLFHYLFLPQRLYPSAATTTWVYFVEPPAGWENLGPQTSETWIQVSWNFWMREAPECLSRTWGWRDGTFGNFLYPFNSQPWGCHLTDPPVSSCFVSSPRSGQPIPGDAPLELPEWNSAVRFRNTSGLPREDRALEWASRSTWFWSLGGALEDSGLSPDKRPCVRRKAGRLGRAWRAPLWARARDRLLLASVSPSALGELSSYLFLPKWFPPPHIALVPSLPHIKSWFFF